MGPRTVNFSAEDKAIINKVNNLLDQLHVTDRVETIADIGAGVFVTLFEGLCGEELPGIIRSPSTREDEIHNCEVVIGSLAGDVLHTSLTHISGVDIIDGSREGILNLTEIFVGLLEYMLNKIESDVSDTEDHTQNLTADDPDLMTRDVLDEILDSELRRERFLQDATEVKNNGPTARWVADCSPSRRDPEPSTTQELIATADDENISPSKAKDTTADLIRESEEIQKRIQENEEKMRRLQEAAKLPPQSRTAPSRPLPVTTLPEESTQGRQSPTDKNRDRTDGLVSERERRNEIIRRLENDPRYKYMLPPTPTETQVEDEETENTFRHLQDMVDETAAMAREAVTCSPSRAQAMLDTIDTAQTRRRPVATAGKSHSAYLSHISPPRGRYGVTERSRRDQGQRDIRSRTAKRQSPSARKASPKPTTDRLSDNELTPSKSKRKVSFLVERSLTDSSPSINQGKPSPVRRAWEDRGDNLSKGRGKTSAASGSYLSYNDSLADKENESYEKRLRQQYEDIVADILSDEESPDRFQSAADYRSKKYKELADRPKPLYTVGDTRQVVDTESKTGKKKIGFLQKIYREDLDELHDEADYLMAKNRQAAKDMEKEYQKKMVSGVKSKSTTEKQAPSVLKKKTKKATPFVSSKAKKTLPSKSVLKAQNKPMTIRDDDDILPLLLEEFPHLHLSVHTWHELWRKGLSQIEQITRSHQEVRRKKSHATNQLEEAEKRQQIMVSIMKKELEHGHRLKEIKDRQAVTISTRNKLHERRQQSARSRHYYDEYQVRMRGKMLKRRTREEMIFKKLFKDGLEIQKERIKELRNYAHEQRDGQAKSQRNEIESLENYYRDQFQMLAENISSEKKDLVVREKAQQKVLTTMKKDLRKKMEKEIKTLQEHLVRDDDDAYFRQLDADRVVQDLKMAKYQVRL